MKRIIAVILLACSNTVFAIGAEGLYWYSENKVVIDGERKEGLLINENQTVSMVNGKLKPYLTCQTNANDETKLMFTCKAGSKTKTFKFNVTDGGNYLFKDYDPDNGGYVKQSPFLQRNAKKPPSNICTVSRELMCSALLVHR
jgi:hypothetical protein